MDLLSCLPLQNFSANTRCNSFSNTTRIESATACTSRVATSQFSHASAKIYANGCKLLGEFLQALNIKFEHLGTDSRLQVLRVTFITRAHRL